VPPGGEIPTEVPAGGEFWAFLRWRRQHKRIVREHQRRGEALPKVAPDAGEGLRRPGDSVTWAGHAAVITRLDGHTILHDPMWSRSAAMVVRRLTPPAPRWEHVPVPEIVTLSHNHYDHMDASTLRRVKRAATICVPRGLARWFHRRWYPRVIEFDWWQTVDLEGLKVTFVPSQHFSGRLPWDRNKSLWGGWVVEGRHRSVYHAGDSGYFSGFREIGDRFRRLDVACLPIGAYEPRWFMRPYHVDPDEAGQAFLDVRAHRFLPIHWGTFRLSDEAMDAPPQRIRAFFEHSRTDPSRLWLPDLGETRLLDRSGPP
jgi:L-ascorbate metabolism protein UlaG (beta-lactamase superfamily)